MIGSFQSLRNEVDPAERRPARLRRRPPHLGRRRHAAWAPNSIVTYSLYVPASLVAGADVRRLVRVPRRLGAAGAARRSASRRPTSRSTTSPSPAGQDRRRGAEAPRERRGAPPRDHQLRHGRPDDDARCCASAARSSATRAPRRPPSASTRCAARPACRARRSSSSSKRRSPNLYGAVPGHITDDEYAEAEALVESKFATDAWLRPGPVTDAAEPALSPGAGPVEDLRRQTTSTVLRAFADASFTLDLPRPAVQHRPHAVASGRDRSVGTRQLRPRVSRRATAPADIPRPAAATDRRD